MLRARGGNPCRLLSALLLPVLLLRSPGACEDVPLEASEPTGGTPWIEGELSAFDLASLPAPSAGSPWALPLHLEDAPADPPADAGVETRTGAAVPPSLDLLADVRFLFLSGFVSAREHEIEGDRFTFKDLNADFGENIGLQGRWSITPANRLELRIAYFLLRGSTTLDSDKVFNDTTLVGGTSLESKPYWFEFRLTYLGRVLELPSIRSSFWVLVGVDYHYIDWRFGATISPTSHKQEPGEDFYVQTFPLPVFGLRYLLEISPEWSFDLRADGFRANDWRHWNNEGGPIYTSSTIVDVLGTLRWQISPRFFVEAGYTFNYYTLDETGPEDGNHLLAREHGPFLGIGVSW